MLEKSKILFCRISAIIEAIPCIAMAIIRGPPSRISEFIIEYI